MQMKKILTNPHCHCATDLGFHHGTMGNTNNIPPGYMFAGLGLGGMLMTAGLISLLILRK